MTAHHNKVCQTLLKWIWYEYEGNGRSQSNANHILHHVLCKKPAQYPTTQSTPLEWWFGMVLHPYGRWPPAPHIKHVKNLFICMNWIWYEYEVDGKSQSYPTACPQWEPHLEYYDWPTLFRVMVWYGVGVVAIWLPAMVEGFQTLSIGMNWILYEYEVDPSLNFVMVVWFVPSYSIVRVTRRPGHGRWRIYYYYGQIVYP
jgi:hypothetical protein